VPNLNVLAGSHIASAFFFCSLGSGKITVFSTVKTNFIIDIFAYVQ
jgi:hypothetical protein